MSKAKNASSTALVTMSLSDESLGVLRELASLGIYGKNEAEVAGRFVDKALEEFVVPPRFQLPLRKGNKRSAGKATASTRIAVSAQKRKRISKP